MQTNIKRQTRFIYRSPCQFLMWRILSFFFLVEMLFNFGQFGFELNHSLRFVLPRPTMCTSTFPSKSNIKLAPFTFPAEIFLMFPINCEVCQLPLQVFICVWSETTKKLQTTQAEQLMSKNLPPWKLNDHISSTACDKQSVVKDFSHPGIQLFAVCRGGHAHLGKFIVECHPCIRIWAYAALLQIYRYESIFLCST